MPTVSVIRGTNEKPAVSAELIKAFLASDRLSGTLFVGYPIIGTPEGKFPIDALYVSPDQGVVVFDLVEGVDVGNFVERQDDAFNKLQARLKSHRDLLRGRELIVEPNTITFAPTVTRHLSAADDLHPIASSETLEESLLAFRWVSPPEQAYERVLSVLENVSSIRQATTRRKAQQSDSRGAKLQKLEGSIATLDPVQNRAVIETVQGVQRIRGLAGSGKTIVLALKAAYLHAQQPDWRIAVTFNTRSLKGQFKRLITSFSLQQAGEEPDWKRLRIINAWGAPGGEDRDGIYHEFCSHHRADFLDFQAAKNRYGARQAFAGACTDALNQVETVDHLYDAILVDEAQDFPPSFLRMCYEILKPPHRLVYAYDELQNLSSSSLPPVAEIFGRNPDGSPRVNFEDSSPGEAPKDVILQKCYRNSRPVLVTAHGLGFGTARQAPRGRTTGLVQMFEHPPLWEEIGYEVSRGQLEPGADVVLERSAESSPSFLEDHSPVDDLIQFLSFKTALEQDQWVAESIRKNLANDELNPDDIIVINPDPFSTRRNVGSIRRALAEFGIASHLAGVDTVADIFFKRDAESVTFTGAFRAKGNEAGMVYVINADECESGSDLATVRNRLFTAITRSKAWVRVVGIGEPMTRLKEEFDRLRADNFKLSFRYPTDEERELLTLIHREITPEVKRKVKRYSKNLGELLVDLASGKVLIEDLPPEVIAGLRERLPED